MHSPPCESRLDVGLALASRIQQKGLCSPTLRLAGGQDHIEKSDHPASADPTAHHG